MTINHFERLGLKPHISNSQLRMFRNEPMAFIGKYMLGAPDEAGPGAWRGLAVEVGLDRMLFGSDKHTATLAMFAQWDELCQGEINDDTDKERGALNNFLFQACDAFADSPVPLQRQARVEIQIPGIAVPLIGFADWVWAGKEGDKGWGSDLKTTWRIPTTGPDPDHVEQVATYSRHFGVPFELVYCSPRKWTRYTIAEATANEAWERVVETAHALQSLLAKVEDAHDALSLFSSNYSSYYFKPAMVAALRAAKARRLL
jgi:hypothetical protein